MDERAVKGFFEESSAVLLQCGEAQAALLKRMADEMIACFERGGTLLICGNGGSASQAQHFAAEFVNKLFAYRKPLPAVALTTDSSALTSIGNDLDFSEIFSRQTEALGRPGDILWGLSTSGSSANIIKACETAKKTGLQTLCFTGPGGSALARLAGLCLSVESRNTARIQEAHLCAGHVLCELVEKHFL